MELNSQEHFCAKVGVEKDTTTKDTWGLQPENGSITGIGSAQSSTQNLKTNKTRKFGI